MEEDHRAGHIIAIGPDEMSSMGFVNGVNLYESKFVSILTDQGAMTLKREMNQDGAHIINGASGRVCAHSFFLNGIKKSSSGNSGAAAAETLSEVKNAVVFKVSADGNLKEFRAGELYKQHCDNRVAPKDSRARG